MGNFHGEISIVLVNVVKVRRRPPSYNEPFLYQVARAVFVRRVILYRVVRLDIKGFIICFICRSRRDIALDEI